VISPINFSPFFDFAGKGRGKEGRKGKKGKGGGEGGFESGSGHLSFYLLLVTAEKPILVWGKSFGGGKGGG